MEYRTTSNWRQLLKTPEIDYCASKKIADMFPAYMKLIEHTKNIYLPNMSVDCPVKPGQYYVRDFEEYTGNPNQYDLESLKTEKLRSGFGTTLPNGVYRFSLTLSTKKDSSVYFLQWLTQINERFNEDNF
jgi:hypothetical protein